jgi:hypothetical protein
MSIHNAKRTVHIEVNLRFVVTITYATNVVYILLEMNQLTPHQVVLLDLTPRVLASLTFWLN